MKMTALVVLLSFSAFAADDAPVLLKAGDPAPVSGVLLPDSLAERKAQQLVGCEAEKAVLKEDVKTAVPVPVIVALVVAGALAGGAAGVGIGVALKK